MKKPFTRYFIPFIILVFINVIACQKSQESNKKFTSKAEIIEAKTWEVTNKLSVKFNSKLSEHLLHPAFVATTSNYITFITELDSSVIKFFSIDNYSFAGDYGIRGKGPGEFTGPPFIMDSIHKDSSDIALLDWGKKAYYRINIPALIKSQKWEPNAQVILPPELISTQRIIYIPEDSSMIGFGGVRQGKLYKHSLRKDSTLTYTPFTPILEERTKKTNPGYLYSGYMAVNRSQKRIAVVSDHFEQLEIYDYDLNLLSITELSENTNFEGDWSKSYPITSETKIYYYDIDMYKDQIYALYDNRTMAERKAGKCPQNASQLHVFDWKGNPLNRIQLEDCPRRIAYDHVNNRIIALFSKKDPMKIVGYYNL